MDQIQSLEWLCQERLKLQDILHNDFSSNLNEYNHMEYPLGRVTVAFRFWSVPICLITTLH